MQTIEFLMAAQTNELGFCGDCKRNMDLAGENYVCGNCGYVEKYYEQGSEKKLSNTRLVIKTSRGNTSTYNHTHDHGATRLQELMKIFDDRARNYTGAAIPPQVLRRVAEMYVDLHQKAKSTKDLRVCYRGANKHQVLARMIYYGCIREKVHRTVSEIADFMGLQQKRFATGENIVRKLQAAGLIDIVVDETPQIIAARYLELFDLRPDLSEFVGDIIRIAQACNIMMQSRMISKTIGVVWLLCCRFRVPTSLTQFEDITGVRAPTFMAFINTMNSSNHFCAFYPIYGKYSVPLI